MSAGLLVLLIIVAVLLVAGAVVVAVQLPEIRRHRRIRAM